MIPPTQDRVEAAAGAIVAAMLTLPERLLIDGADVYTAEEIKTFAAAAIAVADRTEWSTDMEAAKKHDALVDIWAGGMRYTNCYYDRICDEWRTTRPAGRLHMIPARIVTHWRPLPAAPGDAVP